MATRDRHQDRCATEATNAACIESGSAFAFTPQRCQVAVLDGPVETLEVIDLQLIRQALTEAQGEPTEAARAQACVASLSALLLMSGDHELGNTLGALIGLRPLDAEALERLILG